MLVERGGEERDVPVGREIAAEVELLACHSLGKVRTMYIYTPLAPSSHGRNGPHQFTTHQPLRFSLTSRHSPLTTHDDPCDSCR